MIPRNFTFSDIDDAAKFFDALDTICDMCDDGVHCCGCAITKIRESADINDEEEDENAVIVSDCCSMQPMTER